MQPQDSFIRIRDAIAITKLSRSTLLRLCSDNQFVPLRRLSAGAVGFLRSEVETWIAARPLVADAPVKRVMPTSPGRPRKNKTEQQEENQNG